MYGFPHAHASGAPQIPLRRVSWVRIVSEHGAVRCEAVGIGHRLPAVRTIGIGTATALVASGVPVVFRTGPGEPARHATTAGR